MSLTGTLSSHRVPSKPEEDGPEAQWSVGLKKIVKGVAISSKERFLAVSGIAGDGKGIVEIRKLAGDGEGA